MEEAAARGAVVRARRVEGIRRPEGTPPLRARCARARRIPSEHRRRRVIQVAQVHAERRSRTGRNGARPERREGRQSRHKKGDRDG